jgi:hypothetical protein
MEASISPQQPGSSALTRPIGSVSQLRRCSYRMLNLLVLIESRGIVYSGINALIFMRMDHRVALYSITDPPSIFGDRVRAAFGRLCFFL